jgi:hypothetical protein
VLDTGFLPISLLMWGILSLGEGGDDPDADRHDDHDHSQADPDGDVRASDSEASRDRWNRRATE